MAEKKPSNREQIKQIVAGIEDGIKELFQSEKFSDYLRTMSKFHNYSYNNTILIHMQMPNATRVAGFKKWKNQFGRHVKKGEKGLTIIAPTPFQKKIEEMKLDPDTQVPVLDAEGNVIMEEKVVEIPLFRPVKVFDVSQTEGPPLPSLVTDLTGNVQQYEAFMEALRRTSPVPISIKPIAENMDGFYHLEDQTITIREGMSQVLTVCTAVHEITHAMLHNREQTRLTAAAGDGTKEPPKAKDKNTREVEAESVSYTVCQYYNIDTSSNSLGYIATWSKDKTLPELKASLETITKTANALITSIDRHFAEVCKERGIDLTAQQPEQNVLSAPADTLEQFAADLYDFMDHLHQAGVLKHPFTLDSRDRSIADLVIEMRAGYFDSVRDPLNHLIEHTNLIPTDLTKAKAMLARLNGLGEIQDTPLAEPPDTLEQFASDMIDLLDRLYAAGLIHKNFPSDDREGTKAYLVHALSVNPPIVRAVLEKFVKEDTGAAEASAMLVRMDSLLQQDAAEQKPPEQEPAPPQDTVLDEYPVPDTTLTLDVLTERGYSGNDLLPLSRDRAAALMEQDMTVYMVQTGENPEMVFDQNDLMEQPEGTMFAVTREEWEESKDFQQAVADRMQHQQEREQAFLDHDGDCFAIYQLRFDGDTLRLRYEPLNFILMEGFSVQRSNYDLAYTALLDAASVDDALNSLWEKFNIDHPADYQRPSMSISDIIAIKRDGVLSCHYCDRVGFVEVPDFLTPKPAIQQKKSVVAQLKSQPPQQRKKTAPKKSAEREF